MGKDYKDLKVGNEFEAFEARATLLRERTRTIIAMAIVLGALIALALAAYFGDQEGNALLKVWGVVSVPIIGIIGYYFRGSKFAGENNN